MQVKKIFILLLLYSAICFPQKIVDINELLNKKNILTETNISKSSLVLKGEYSASVMMSNIKVVNPFTKEKATGIQIKIMDGKLNAIFKWIDYSELSLLDKALLYTKNNKNNLSKDFTTGSNVVFSYYESSNNEERFSIQIDNFHFYGTIQDLDQIQSFIDASLFTLKGL